MSKTYTIQELADMTGLSTRTLRTYIQQGHLQGEKAADGWKFTPEAFGQLLENPNVRPAILAKGNGLVYDFLIQRKKEQPAACLVLDLPLDAHPSKELVQAITALVNQLQTTDPALHFQLDAHRGQMRVIVSGQPQSAAKLLAFGE